MSERRRRRDPAALPDRLIRQSATRTTSGMPIRGGVLAAAGIAVAMALLASAFFLLTDNSASEMKIPSRAADTSIPVAVLGDSDSHSYHDSVFFEPGSPERGGLYRPSTFQWTEVLAKLRGEQLDLGAWGIWGSRGSIARLRDVLGLSSRAPKKQDYRHDFAVSGAGCSDLMQGNWRQAPRLLELMDRDASRWRDGIVIIRIGINSFGKADSLDRLARDPESPEVQAKIAQCVSDIRAVVALLRARHPQTRFVLVGIFDNVHWPKYFGRWHSTSELERISAGLDRFDTALRESARADARMAFFDDRAWFARRWGSRGGGGQPAYREVALGRAFKVSNSVGDHPRHSVLGDGHAGAVWNALWARSMVELMNARFGTRLRPIDDAEIIRLLDPDGSIGIR